MKKKTQSLQKVVREELMKFWDQVLEPVMATKQDFHGLDGKVEGLDKRIDKLDRRIDNLETGQLELKRQITDLKVDKPMPQEFRKLERRVAKVERFSAVS